MAESQEGKPGPGKSPDDGLAGGISAWYSKPGVADDFARYQIPGTRQYRRRSPERRAVEAMALSLPASMSVLDAPCGTGRYSDLLGRFAFSCSADVSPEMLRIAAASAAPESALCAADNYGLPFKDRAFDAVFCLRFLHHIPDALSRRRCVAEIARVTRSVLVLTYFESRSLKHLVRIARAGIRGRPTLRFACAFREIAADFASAGFRVEKVVSPVPLLGENRVLLCRRNR